MAEGDALVGANADGDEERGEYERQDQYRPQQPLPRSLCIADRVRYCLHLHSWRGLTSLTGGKRRSTQRVHIRRFEPRFLGKTTTFRIEGKKIGVRREEEAQAQ